jgi:hypothetical protein
MPVLPEALVPLELTMTNLMSGVYTSSMLPISFDDIAPEDIVRLVTDKVSERKTLEFKRTLNIGNTDDKAEFLADVSSFANASGGDILFGITDERGEDGNATGIPGEIVGLTVSNAGTECNRIEQLIQTGLQPRLPIVFVKALVIPERGMVIVIRVGKSWTAPHMVSYANRTRFFSRNSSSGKVLLDVHQIGAAFAEQRGIGERLRAWKADRISKTLSGESPVGLTGARLLFHFIPAATLMVDGQSLPRVFDTNKWGNGRLLMSLSPEWSRYNADGFLLTSRESTDEGRSYLQVFKDGSLEYGDSYVLRWNGRGSIPSGILEEKLVATFGQAMSLLKGLEVSPPVYVTLTLIDVKGAKLATPYFANGYESHPIDRVVVVCPDVEVQHFAEDPPYPATLLPIINSVWQAAGIAQSLNIKQDQWVVNY